MASNASVEAYKRRVNRIPQAVRRASFEALSRHATAMTASMKAAVPKERGNLSASIVLDLQPDNLRAVIRAGGSTTTNGGYDYAMAQEFGTEKMPANPFFWPSYRLHKKSMRRAVKSAMTKAIKKEFPIESKGYV